MAFLAGLDLAWTTYRKSGVCILETANNRIELVKLEARVDTAEGFVAELLALGPDVIAAVDAPLIRRDGCVAERELARVFGRFHASAYNANIAFLERHNIAAGPRLGLALGAAGFDLDPLSLKPGAEGFLAFEMYPHAFHVAAFELERRLGYKKGRMVARREAFMLYQAALARLIAAEVPELAESAEIRAILSPAAIQLGGRALKEVEDQLDALTCALAALVAWRNGIRREDVFGDAESGYIAVPGLHRIARFMAPSLPG